MTGEGVPLIPLSIYRIRSQKNFHIPFKNDSRCSGMQVEFICFLGRLEKGKSSMPFPQSLSDSCNKVLLGIFQPVFGGYRLVFGSSHQVQWHRNTRNQQNSVQNQASYLSGDAFRDLREGYSPCKIKLERLLGPFLVSISSSHGRYHCQDRPCTADEAMDAMKFTHLLATK